MLLARLRTQADGLLLFAVGCLALWNACGVSAAPLSDGNAAWNLNRGAGISDAALYRGGDWPTEWARAASPPDWRRRSIYHVMLDRFSDGDPRNNGGDHDLEHPNGRHGGDLAGARAKLAYIDGLGFDTLWIGPLYVAWHPSDQRPFPSYHHYHPLDWTLVDERLGTLLELQRLVADAHARGMRVLVDVVPNHIGARFDFAGREGASAPFGVHGEEYELVPTDSVGYEDFEVNNTFDGGCTYAAEYNSSRNDGAHVTDSGSGGYCLSDVHHNGDCAGGNAPGWDDRFTPWRPKRCRFADVLDVRHESARVVDKFVASVCALFESADVDGLRVDAVQVSNGAGVLQRPRG